jgi:DNA-binding GntR family transcriptional regulator
VSDGRKARGLRPLEAPRSLAEDAAERIREQILAGGFSQGEHLVESRIAEQLNVSRGPVREAFKLLRAEGLVQEEPRRGTFVVTLAPDDVREIYGLRAAVEGRAARLVATHRDAAALDELRRGFSALERAVAGGRAAEIFAADLELHSALCLASGNSRLHEVFVRYVPVLRALLRLDEHLYRTLEDIAEQHRPLLDAIERGDAEAASAAAEHHVDDAAGMIAAYLATRPTASTPA